MAETTEQKTERLGQMRIAIWFYLIVVCMAGGFLLARAWTWQSGWCLVCAMVAFACGLLAVTTRKEARAFNLGISITGCGLLLCVLSASPPRMVGRFAGF